MPSKSITNHDRIRAAISELETVIENCNCDLSNTAHHGDDWTEDRRDWRWLKRDCEHAVETLREHL